MKLLEIAVGIKIESNHRSGHIFRRKLKISNDEYRLEAHKTSRSVVTCRNVGSKRPNLPRNERNQLPTCVVAPVFSVSQFPPMTDYLNISETEPLLETLAMNGGGCFFINLAMAGSALTKIRAMSSP